MNSKQRRKHERKYPYPVAVKQSMPWEKEMELRGWLVKNYGKQGKQYLWPYTYLNNSIYFRKLEHATMFALTWV
jgi:hypothetical protein